MFALRCCSSSSASLPIIAGIDLDAIVQSIDAEIARLEKARALLTGHTVPLKRGMASSESPGSVSQ